jgi:hypothetical protein
MAKEASLKNGGKYVDTYSCSEEIQWDLGLESGRISESTILRVTAHL